MLNICFCFFKSVVLFILLVLSCFAFEVVPQAGRLDFDFNKPINCSCSTRGLGYCIQFSHETQGKLKLIIFLEETNSVELLR